MLTNATAAPIRHSEELAVLARTSMTCCWSWPTPWGRKGDSIQSWWHGQRLNGRSIRRRFRIYC